MLYLAQKVNMSKKIKILYVITQGAWGGAQRYVFDLATNLGQDFDIYIAVGEDTGPHDLQKKLEDWQAEHAQTTFTILSLKHLYRSIKPTEDLLAVLELARAYHRIKPDIVHLNSTKAGIVGSLAKWGRFLRKMSVVYTVHGWVFNEPLNPKVRWFYVWLERLTASFKEKIIVLSEPDHLDGQKVLEIPPNRFATIPLGIDPPEPAWSPIKAREVLGAYLSISSQTPRRWIGTIANFYHTKGLDILVEAVAKIKDRLPPILFTFIGEGPGQLLLETLIKKHELTDTIYLSGSLENAASLIPAFDLFIVPSRKEGLPYVILEAMAVGCPVIATKVGGIPTLIEHKKTGLLVDTPEASLLGEQILYAIAHMDEMESFANQAKEKRQYYTLPTMTEGTKAIYYSLT